MNDRFGSTARDFAAGIVTREGGTPEDVVFRQVGVSCLVMYFFRV